MALKFIPYLKTFKGLSITLLSLFVLTIAFLYLTDGFRLTDVLTYFFWTLVVIGLIFIRGIAELLIKGKKKTLLGVIIFTLIIPSYFIYPIALLVYYDKQFDRVVNREATDVSSCEVIEYGYSACGGPASYLIYSTETTDVQKLEPLVDKYDKADEKFNTRLMLASGCSMAMKPDFILENNTCVGVEKTIR